MWQQYDRATPQFGRKLMELSNKNYEGIWSGGNNGGLAHSVT